MPLDVTDDASVAAAAELIADQAGGLDVLVNNAAINGVTGDMPRTLTTVDPATVRTIVETDVIGVGALTLHTTPGIDMGPVPAAYLASKTVLNAVTTQYVKELRETNILINSGCPGLTATDFTGFSGDRTPQQGAAIAIHLATLGRAWRAGGEAKE